MRTYDLGPGIVRRMRRLSLAALALCAGLLLATPVAHAQDVAPASGAAVQTVITLTPRADATVDSAQPATAFGGAADLRAASLPESVAQSLVRFDLSMFPAGTTINSATLRLAQSAAAGAPPAWEIPISQIFTDWDEATVTWATRPSIDLVVGSLTSPNQANVTVNADVTALVDKWINAAGNSANYGLALGAFGNETSSRTFNSREGARPPQLIVDYTLPPLRVCREQIDSCPAASGAIVSFVGDGADRIADRGGYVDATGLALGQRVWARWQAAGGNGGLLFHTLPAAATIAADQFVFGGNSTEMRMAVTADKPLWVQALNVSAEWYVEANAADAGRLRARIINASNFLYSFTDGQFALGAVTVRQRYDGWNAANVRLFANNTLQPKAIIGGIVSAPTPDFAPTVPITYTPGVVSIGSYWNRFGSPPNAVNIFEGTHFDEAAMVNDWALALAHEFGHYLLYLYDTYTGVDGVSDIALTKLCTGTAMGDVYRPANQNFIFDPTQWLGKCSGTEAFARLGGRTEWQTIAGWYPWVMVPSAVVAGPAAPPTPLTTVSFVAPSETPGPAAPSLFNLDYRDNERSSGEARAFLYQGAHMIEQGKPAKDSLSVQVTGAELADRLCVYDINDHAEAGQSPRHQFACEQIVAGDDTLFMTKNPAWDPQVSIRQVGAQQVQVIVTETLPLTLAVGVRIFPEHEASLLQANLPRVGNVYSATFALGQPVPPLYVQLFVNETPALPLTRREVVADRGTGGGGAFGPAKAYGGALVLSSDGNASFAPDADLDLQPGESIAWQSMPGTPMLPFFKWISGQSYRLTAFPPGLVQDGTVRIVFGEFSVAQAAAAGAAAPAVYFWNGSTWRALPTTLATPAGATDGAQVASARSQGVGVYAVLTDAPAGSTAFLPAVRSAMQ